MINHKPAWLTDFESELLMRTSQTWPFDQPEVVVWEKRHKIPRLTCWFTDTGEGYRYSGQVAAPHQWAPEVLVVKTRLEAELGTKFKH